MPNSEFLEVSLSPFDLTYLDEFNPSSTKINTMKLIISQGNKDLLPTLKNRKYFANVNEMKSSITCSSIYENLSSFPIRCKLLVPSSFIEYIDEITFNETMEINKTDFSKYPENDKYSLYSLSRRIPSHSEIKITFVFTTKVDEGPLYSSINFINEPIANNEIASFNFVNAGGLVPWKIPTDFSLDLLEAAFIFSPSQNVIKQQISQFINGTIIFRYKPEDSPKYYFFLAKSITYDIDVEMHEDTFVENITIKYKSPLPNRTANYFVIKQEGMNNVTLDIDFQPASFLKQPHNIYHYQAKNLGPDEEGSFCFQRIIPAEKDILSNKIACKIPCDANTELKVEILESKRKIVKVKPTIGKLEGRHFTASILSKTPNLRFAVHYEPQPIFTLEVALSKYENVEANNILNVIKNNYENVNLSLNPSNLDKNDDSKDNEDDNKIYDRTELNLRLLRKIDKVICNFSIELLDNGFSNQFLHDFSLFSNIFNTFASRATSDIEIELFNSSFFLQKTIGMSERVIILPAYSQFHDVFQKEERYFDVISPTKSGKSAIIPFLAVRDKKWVICIKTDSTNREFYQHKIGPFTNIIYNNVKSVLNYKGEKLFAILKPMMLMNIIKILEKNEEIDNFIQKSTFLFDDFYPLTNENRLLLKKLVTFIKNTVSTNDLKLVRISKTKLKPINEDEIIESDFEATLSRTMNLSKSLVTSKTRNKIIHKGANKGLKNSVKQEMIKYEAASKNEKVEIVNETTFPVERHTVTAEKGNVQEALKMEVLKVAEEAPKANWKQLIIIRVANQAQSNDLLESLLSAYNS
ncbi:hypothetical protein TRFO_10242 [Tritrichomonas foetus]|uniref:Uncharacterized protein n=1 Tax=Tritrichomonas foetus TaxID=1144522 RepID=A0A1J4JA66_9EUKA|nr:hypothetical protein TRFO_10242 [Tritrichomonas foetus]|eukprot:OHS96056.1 hypothetical protein TRFO_10242 [Tritrichomonas foetus]